MTNDTTTLNGALSELGETLASNLTAKGVTASANDGLTTLANKINQIPECYFKDTLDTTDYLLTDSSISSVTVDNGAIKILNTSGANKSVFFTLNRSPIMGNWKATYQLKTYTTITIYHRLGGSRVGNIASHNTNVNLSSFTQVEWKCEDGIMTIKVDGNEVGSVTYTTGMYYPIFAYYFNANEYALVKDLQIIKI